MQQQPERRPDDALPAEAVDIALSFIEIAVHAVLFARGIYPREAFSRAAAFGIATWQCRSPEVCAQLQALLVTLRAPLRRGEVEALSMVIAAPGGRRGGVVEQYTFEFDFLAAIAGAGGAGAGAGADASARAGASIFERPSRTALSSAAVAASVASAMEASYSDLDTQFAAALTRLLSHDVTRPKVAEMVRRYRAEQPPPPPKPKPPQPLPPPQPQRRQQQRHRAKQPRLSHSLSQSQELSGSRSRSPGNIFGADDSDGGGRRPMDDDGGGSGGSDGGNEEESDGGETGDDESEPEGARARTEEDDADEVEWTIVVRTHEVLTGPHGRRKVPDARAEAGDGGGAGLLGRPEWQRVDEGDDIAALLMPEGVERGGPGVGAGAGAGAGAGGGDAEAPLPPRAAAVRTKPLKSIRAGPLSMHVVFETEEPARERARVESAPRGRVH